jgi:hypothetical protein
VSKNKSGNALRPDLSVYHSIVWWLGQWLALINLGLYVIFVFFQETHWLR